MIIKVSGSCYLSTNERHNLLYLCIPPHCYYSSVQLQLCHQYTLWSYSFQSLVYTMNKNAYKTHPCGAPGFIVMVQDFSDSVSTYCGPILGNALCSCACLNMWVVVWTCVNRGWMYGIGHSSLSHGPSKTSCCKFIYIKCLDSRRTCFLSY